MWLDHLGPEHMRENWYEHTQTQRRHENTYIDPHWRYEGLTSRGQWGLSTCIQQWVFNFIWWLQLVLLQSSLKIADHQDWTGFGPDQTTQAVYSSKTENDGPDCGQTEDHKWTVHYFQNGVWHLCSTFHGIKMLSEGFRARCKGGRCCQTTCWGLFRGARVGSH